ncbi:succinate dehydrogenase cytochrome b subunit [Neolewinella lacunae]|uniref:Succinate dehydrogenase cytochrome b subunit n=1 Tax=Neolewinella lacunae TaxID=1517758 RepID=A0A923PM14_9BACT|nr:succinate dehydrogenase cytochrome b subunit [Neolewinella lacunae]MBC6993663.1 succinate dehydrogenase cytochrome b subunit [Neolewinella lacunae]MDN3636358.1 succinate dehydrogenase cytochrome b subunit [Neolewinella lacunae]
MKSWFVRFITSSIGKKVVMALTGLFLISFLAVHLAGNVQLMFGDGGQAFNEYAYFMTHNPVIKFTSYGLYAFILLHAIQGLILWNQNRLARGSQGYAVKRDRLATAPKSSLYMGSLGMVILIFIIIHMVQFWAQMKFTGNVAEVTYPGAEYAVKDLYTLVYTAFTNIWFVIFYVISMVFIAFHLFHGFESAFQTLGLNHKKWTPLIKFVGRAYSILVPLGFAIIPLYVYFYLNQ